MRKRQSCRIRCKIKSTLEYHGRIYRGHIENISINGALLRLNETVLARPGDECRLSVYLAEHGAPLKLNAEMVHVGFSMAGMRFLQMEEQEKSGLALVLEHIANSVENTDQSLPAMKVS